ncbi:MAG TPA: hypothetical protein VKW04_09455 [Planctomycetota bacterium]|nr:hypothetical protein [Planctomycetota bacterium]
MIRLSPGIALLSLWAWGCSGNGAEIPTVEFGGPTGARLMNGQAKSPADAYDNAYSQLTRAHYNVHRNLDARGQNPLGAKEAVVAIIQSLETMKSCVAAADQAPFDPYIARYAVWQKDIENGTWGGAFLTDLERTEREVKSKFNPGSVQVLAEFPGSVKPAPAPAKAPEPPFSDDKVEVPVLKKPDRPDPAKVPPPEVPAVNPEILKRLHFKSWDRAHDDLIAAYKDRKDCTSKYEDVVAALKILKGECAGEQVTLLDIYLNYYADVSDKTKTFTALPEKTTERDILDELDVAARVIRKRFNPDK